MVRKWDEKWRSIAEKAGQFKEYEINDDLLKEILIKIYYNNFRYLAATEESVSKEIESRKFIKSLIFGDYTPHGVVYAVQGSPPRGNIYVPHIDYEKSMYFFNGRMASLNSDRFYEVRKLFLRDAKQFIMDWHRDNPLPK